LFMKRTGLTTRHWLATLALTTLLWAAPGLAQSPNTPPNGVPPQAPPQASPQAPPQANDIRRNEVDAMGRFLLDHPEIAEQLQKDPKLIDDQKFVADHTALHVFLAEHPEIRQQFDEHPYAFMRDEDRFLEAHRDDIERREVALMGDFLEKHPEIAEELQKNAKLIDDRKFVADHPALDAFLRDHPEVRQEFDAHPYAFMHDEDEFLRAHRDDDITRREVAMMGEFLDKHPEIGEQLQKDPRLIDDKKFVADHPALDAFLRDHPEVRQQFDEHPVAFMHDVDRFDRQHEVAGNGNMNRGDLSGNFHEFLAAHGAIADQLSKNPTLANNDEYLQNHTELQAYLQANPQVREQLNADPQSFVKSAQPTDTTTKTMTKLPGQK
jgi:hypothetical protein